VNRETGTASSKTAIDLALERPSLPRVSCRVTKASLRQARKWLRAKIEATNVESRPRLVLGSVHCTPSGLPSSLSSPAITGFAQPGNRRGGLRDSERAFMSLIMPRQTVHMLNRVHTHTHIRRYKLHYHARLDK